MNSKIGILGGTFDPVHNGHIRMAYCALNEARLDKIIFLPNGNPPHKRIGEYTDATHRYNMLKIATEHDKRFEVSDYELSGERHYTYDTMEHFKSLYPQSDVLFIVGADSLDYLHKWYRAEELIKNNAFVVINRNFRENYSLDDNIAYIKSLGGRVIRSDMGCVDISSTQVRSYISQGIEALPIPDRVADYIIFNKLYGKE